MLATQDRVVGVRWRKINAPHLVPLVRAGAVFIDGKLQERTTNQPDTDTIEEEEVAA